MRISDSNDLGKALQEEFGGKLTVDRQGDFQIENVPPTQKEKINAAIVNYYTKTLGCEDVSTCKTSENRDLFFEKQEGYEALAVTYTEEPVNRLLVSIIDMHPRS